MSSFKEVFCIDPAVKKAEKSTHELIKKFSPIPVSVHLPVLSGMQSIFKREQEVDLKAIILLGSYSSVYDRLPWQKSFFSWFEKCLSAKTPCLAICFGHQLVAHLFGSRVSLLKNPSKGVRKIRSAKKTPIHNVEADFVVSHREIVSDSPRELEPLLVSDDFKHEGFYHPNQLLWTSQAHIEATLDFCQNYEIQAVPKDLNFSFGHGIIERFFKKI